MTRLMRLLLAIFALLGMLSIDPLAAQSPDTTRFTPEEFLSQLRANHPVLKQAEILPEQAQRALQAARGGFDPKLAAELRNKDFTGKEYYDNFDGSLTVPTLPGIDLKAGYERNEGVFLNPEHNTPAAGLWYTGVRIPLGGELIMDQRRRDLRQAELLPDMARADRMKVVNKLLLSAVKAYLDWQGAYLARQFRQEGLELAQARFDAVRERAAVGDLPPIDTTEALLEVQKRQMLLQEARLAEETARLAVSDHLWQPGRVPAQLPENTLPALPPSIQADTLPLQPQLTRLDSAHPALRKLRLKQESLRFERRYRQWQLLPTVELTYNVLFEPNRNLEVDGAFLRDNFKLGVRASVPLFQRKNRAKLATTDLKIQTNLLELASTRLRLKNRLRQAHRRAERYRQLWEWQDQAAQNAARLHQGELELFRNGESDLFRVNRRERSLMDARAKRAKLRAKYLKALAEFYWSAARPPSEVWEQ